VKLYKTKDNRWLSLCFLQDRWFADLAPRIGREDLLADPRFADEESKFLNGVALGDELQRTFLTKTLAEWNDLMFDAEGVWAPLQSPGEVITDIQAVANGFVTPVTDYDGETYFAAASPGQFDERPVGPLKSSPGYGQHTDGIMRDLGLSDAQIAALRDAKIVV
jgi:formyl-CoA transferase